MTRESVTSVSAYSSNWPDSARSCRAASIAAASSPSVKRSPRRSRTGPSGPSTAQKVRRSRRKAALSNSVGTTSRSGRLDAPGGSIWRSPSGPMTPRRNTTDETCPSPMARRLIRKRTLPGGTPSWSRAGTIDGLNSATDSRAYSIVKQAPISSRRGARRRPLRQAGADHLVVLGEHRADVAMPAVERAGQHIGQRPDLRLGDRQGAVDDPAHPVHVPGAEEPRDDPVRVGP